MTDDHISRIEAALNAGPTPGDWAADFASAWRDGSRETVEYFVRRDGEDISIAADIVDPETGLPSAVNADYIAACNPVAIRALLDRLKAAEGEIERLRDCISAREVRSLVDERDRLRAERESFYMDYRIKCDEETKRQAAEIERLRAALERAHDVWETEAAGMRDEIERLREDNETLNEIIEIHGVEINRLRSERDVAELMSLALKCDAERYRWLRGGPEVPPHSTRWPRWEVRYWDGRYWQTLFAEQLDAATDAAMKEGK